MELCICKDAIAVLHRRSGEFPIAYSFADIRSIHPMLLLKISKSSFLEHATSTEEDTYTKKHVYDVRDNFEMALRVKFSYYRLSEDA